MSQLISQLMTRRKVTKSRPVMALLLALSLPAGGVGCSQQMATDGKLTTYMPTPLFPDHRAGRDLIPGTIARGALHDNEAYFAGTSHGRPIREIPIRVTAGLLRRGQQRFNIYCAPCHNETGDGDGIIVRRGFLRPPSYHTDRLRSAPAGHFYEVIIHGSGAMYGYGDRVTDPRDRWAIVAYIRALQLSRNTPISQLPEAERARLLRAPLGASRLGASPLGASR